SEWAAGALHDVAQRHALDVLHDDVRRAVRRDAEVEHLGEIRMAQLLAALGLAAEALAQLFRRGELRLHHLDDADLVEEAVASLVDRAHPALAHLLEDLVRRFDLFGEDAHRERSMKDEGARRMRDEG